MKTLKEVYALNAVFRENACRAKQFETIKQINWTSMALRYHRVLASLYIFSNGS